MARPVRPPRIERGENGYFYVHFHDGKRGRRETLATKDIDEAGQRFAFWLTATGKPQSSHRICDLIDLYDTEHVDTCADSSRQRQRLALVRAYFGHMDLDDVSPSVVTGYSLTRKSVKPATIRGELAILKAALNHNVRARRIESVPHIPLPPKSEPRDRWLTLSEIDVLTNEAEKRRRGDRLSRVERFVWIALDAPARKNSIECLEWDRVDLGHGSIDFRTPGKQITKKKQVVVPISDRLKPILERAHRERTSNYVLDSAGSIRTAFENLVIQAEMPDVTPHVLRHTAATHMARSGIPLWLIAGILGNSMQMVEQTYAHHSPDSLRKAINYERDNPVPGGLDTGGHRNVEPEASQC